MTSPTNKLREAAERIIKKIEELLPFGVRFGYGKVTPAEAIESILRETVEEALQAHVDAETWITVEIEKEKKQVRSEALEEAAKIAEELCWKDHGNDNCINIPYKLRELKP